MVLETYDSVKYSYLCSSGLGFDNELLYIYDVNFTFNKRKMFILSSGELIIQRFSRQLSV